MRLSETLMALYVPHLRVPVAQFMLSYKICPITESKASDRPQTSLLILSKLKLIIFYSP